MYDRTMVLKNIGLQVCLCFVLISCFLARLVAPAVYWLAGRLAGWLAGRQAGRQAGRLAGWLAGWLAVEQEERIPLQPTKSNPTYLLASVE